MFLLMILSPCAAQQSFVYTGHGHFHNVFCHSLKAIKEDYFEKHALPGSVIDTTYLPGKTSHQIIIQNGYANLVFQDDTDKYGIYFRNYFYAGNDRERNWILIRRQEQSRSYYFLVHQNSLAIDTLVGYPQIVGNKMLCLESKYVNSENRIEVWAIVGENLEPKTLYSLSRCQLDAKHIALSADNELMIEVQQNSYFKVDLPDY